MTSAVISRVPIRFHRLTDPYGEFTNFSRHPVIIDDVLWSTCEHYFQAAKFTDTDHAQRIQWALTPSRAAALGRTRARPIRPDWDTARIEVMRTGMRAKFVQHPRLAQRLLATETRPLIETTRDDAFWGAGADGTGLNTIGRLLSEIRTELAASRIQWIPPVLPSRRWVAFGDEIVVVPRPCSGSRYVAVRAWQLLHRTCPTDAINRSTDPEPHLRIEVPGEGEVLLRAHGGPDDVGAVLTRAASLPITWVHDRRWPRRRPR
jgi:ribA/ribD-fused uncharacterized protein